VTSILVADRRDIFRSGVRALLAQQGDFEVVVASELGGALSAVDQGEVDVALVDLELPPAGGIAAVRELVRRSACRVVVWSFDPDSDTVLEAIRAGASGYLEKTISPRGLVRALHGACRGEAALPRALAALMIDALHNVDERVRAREQAAVLSSREREVLDLISRGAANRQIAAQLAISEFTVKRHVQNILQKLELPSRHAAASLWGVAFRPADAGAHA